MRCASSLFRYFSESARWVSIVKNYPQVTHSMDLHAHGFGGFIGNCTYTPCVKKTSILLTYMISSTVLPHSWCPQRVFRRKNMSIFCHIISWEPMGFLSDSEIFSNSFPYRSFITLNLFKDSLALLPVKSSIVSFVLEKNVNVT